MLHACMMLLAMPWLDLRIYVFISMLYGKILVFTCLYAWIHVLTCLCARLLHAYMLISMLICVDRCVYMLRSMFSICFMPSSMCLGLDLVCHAMCYCSIFIPFYRIFLCFGLMVRTRSRAYGLCHHPYTKAHIKGFGSSYLHVYACLFYVLYLC